MASLTSIPLELLVIISSQLSTPDLGSLRRTCKYVERSLYDSFAREFFSKKQFMLTRPSLQALIDISNHPTLSKQVNHVIIGLDRYGYPTSGTSFRDYAAYQRYSQGHADQTLLSNTGLHREMLTEAFQNLPNLETVGVRDFNSRGRLRDGDIEWTSYGATTVFRDTGKHLETNQQPIQFSEGVQVYYASRMWTLLLYALGKANRTPPSFEILLRQRNSGLVDHAFNIPDFILPTLAPVLRGMKNLLLTLDQTPRLLGTYPEQATDRYDQPPGLFLQHFLTHTPNLTHLRLNFQRHHEIYNMSFLQWLGKSNTSGTSNLTDLSPPAFFPHLECLEFGMLTAEPDNILIPIAKFAPTLKRLSLWRITLSPGVGTAISPPYNQNQDLWAPLFTALSKIPHLDLDYIKVGMAALRIQLALPVKADFRILKGSPNVLRRIEDLAAADSDSGQEGDANDHTALKRSVEYEGKETNVFLKNLAKTVHVYWPEVTIGFGSESDEDEDMINLDGEDDEGDEDEDNNGE